MVNLKEKVTSLRKLLEEITSLKDIDAKLALLSPQAEPFINNSPALKTFTGSLTPECLFVIYSVIAIGQAPNVLYIPENSDDKFSKLRQLLQDLLFVERFYHSIGGIIGYHLTFLELCLNKIEPPQTDQKKYTYHNPPIVDIRHETKKIRQNMIKAIEHIDKMAEIYPVGGAGDRLGLTCEVTSKPLPAATLAFGGKTLLEGMVQDIQTREYLHYKLFGNQVITPIALMTSHEKDNHNLIEKICNDKSWFHRPKELFLFFTQQSVPVINKNGDWMMTAPLEPRLKPGGHGAIWELALEQDIFNKLSQLKRTKAIIRQVNNPVANVDHGLIAFAGVGIEGDYTFGFAACQRIVDSAQGIDVLRERKCDNNYEYTITNIEYTDFVEAGIKDEPIEPDSPYSEYPANTNVLFFDVDKIRPVAEKNPLPGLVINLKNKLQTYIPGKGLSEEAINSGRLELTMQNIADNLIEKYSSPQKQLKNVFVTYNERHKTMSPTKKLYTDDSSPHETPDSCFHDMLCNHYDLLTNHCNIQLPDMVSLKEHIDNAPIFYISYHPALGPLYSIIKQKIRGGIIHNNSELQLNIAELDIENIDLSGSLIINATNIMGHNTPEKILHYSDNTGKCTLKNVTIKNKGINFSADNVYWKADISRHETIKITIHGNSEFYAENITFNGNIDIEIPEGFRYEAYEENNTIKFHKTPIEKPSWHWQYNYDNEYNIILKSKN